MPEPGYLAKVARTRTAAGPPCLGPLVTGDCADGVRGRTATAVRPVAGAACSSVVMAPDQRQPRR
jgi:hypothetical protein